MVLCFNSVSCDLEPGCQVQLDQKVFEVCRDWLCVAAVLTAQVVTRCVHGCV